MNEIEAAHRIKLKIQDDYKNATEDYIAAVIVEFAEPLIALLRESKRIHHDQCQNRAANGYKACNCGAGAWNKRIDEVIR